MNSIYWLIVLIILIFIEIITLGLTTIWFAGGAVAAFILSLFYDNLLVEIIVFIIVSILLLYFTRPIVLKYFNPKRVKTNYEGIIGKEAIVIITIDNFKATGQVSVEGQEWSAKALEGDMIEEGSRVQIHGITGVRLIVSKLKEG